MDPVLAVPLSFHNFWVTVLCIPVVVWAVQIGCRILVAVFLHYRLNLSRPLVLEGMSIFVDDFQQLIRQHFNQILRIRRTVPSKEISQMQVKVHVQPESLAVQFLTGDSDRVIVQFSADASQPCTVSLFWGVTGLACQDMIRRATERRGQEGQLVFADLERAASAVFPSGQYAHRSSATIPAGLGQKVRLGKAHTHAHAILTLKPNGCRFRFLLEAYPCVSSGFVPDLPYSRPAQLKTWQRSTDRALTC